MPPGPAAEQPHEGAVVIAEEPLSTWVRSPEDWLRLIVASVVVVVALTIEAVAGDSLPQEVASYLRGLDVLPSWLILLVAYAARLFAVGAVVGGLILAFRYRRGRNIVVVVGAALVAVAAMALTNALDAAPADRVVAVDDPVAGFPTGPGLAAMAAVVTASAPWLSRRWRRVAWSSVLLLALARFLATPISFETERAVLLGWLAGAAALVVAGGPNRRAGGAAVADGLAAVGVPLRRLEQASLDARASRPYFAEDRHGRRLFVKVLGADERNADLMFRLYRWLTPRNLADGRPFASLRHAVEREVLVAVMARKQGVRVPDVVAYTTAEPNSYVIAYEAIDGKSLDRVDPHEVDDDLVRSTWGQLAALRRSRIAHRDLRLANTLVAADRNVWLIDFGFSELAASEDQLANDIVELLVSSSLLVGPDRAVRIAWEAIGTDALQGAMVRLHGWAVGSATRAAIKERPGLLKQIRGLVAVLPRASAAPAPGGPR